MVHAVTSGSPRERIGTTIITTIILVIKQLKGRPWGPCSFVENGWPQPAWRRVRCCAPAATKKPRCSAASEQRVKKTR
jgi:hypothetical protein